MYQYLQWACVAIFTVAIPLVVLARYRYPEFPAWYFIVLATVLGWVLANAHAGIEHLWVDADRREELAALHEAILHPPPPSKMADGSFETNVGPGISEFLWEEYHPATAMIYGPAYLLGCWLAAQAFFRRSAPQLRRPMLLVSVGILLAAWTAILGEPIKIKPPDIFGDGIFIYGWNPFFGPQLTLPMALLTAWLMIAWLPTAFAWVLKRRIKKA
jgi:hypothetical protein